MSGYVNGATIQFDGGEPHKIEYAVLGDRISATQASRDDHPHESK